MHYKFFFCCLCLLSCDFTEAQSGDISTYLKRPVNDTLKKDANAISMLNERVVEYSGPSEYKLKDHEIIEVFSKDGDFHLTPYFWINKFTKYPDIDIKVMNLQGIEIKRYSKKDFDIRNYYEDGNLITDDKLMQLIASPPPHPYILDITYLENVSGCINLPSLFINNNTEEYRFIVKLPASLDIRYNVRNFSSTPIVAVESKMKTYTWEGKNIVLPVINTHGYEKSFYLPRIDIAQNNFIYDGYEGDFRTWKEFGKWNYSFYEDKPVLNEDRMAEIKAMVPSFASLNEKVSILYEYMQKNMRYVSIQLGIGGFKPFSAKFVDRNKYGDCKALTNYMRNLLTVVGIKSYPALINSGYNSPPVDENFPVNRFNHVILCIPNNPDSIWLECTSIDDKAGFLGSFTENKYALLLTENGGQLVRTPISKAANTKLVTKTEVNISEDGSAEAKSYLYVSGDLYSLFNHYSQYETDRKKEIFVKLLNFRQPENFSIQRSKDSAGGAVFDLTINFNKGYDFRAGNKFFFPQRINELCDEQLNPSESRNTDYVFQYPYEKADTSVFHLQHGFSSESLPPELDLENEYASYKRQAQFNKESVSAIVITKLVLKKNIIPASAYKKLADFFVEVNKDQARRMIFVKN